MNLKIELSKGEGKGVYMIDTFEEFESAIEEIRKYATPYLKKKL